MHKNGIVAHSQLTHRLAHSFEKHVAALIIEGKKKKSHGRSSLSASDVIVAKNVTFAFTVETKISN